MRYPVVHKRALGCGAVYGPPETRPASAQDFEDPELGKARKELAEARAFSMRVLGERAALSGILGEEKAKLAVLQAMDGLRNAEQKLTALGGLL